MFANMEFRLDVVKNTTPHQFTVLEASANAALRNNRWLCIGCRAGHIDNVRAG